MHLKSPSMKKNPICKFVVTKSLHINKALLLFYCIDLKKLIGRTERAIFQLIIEAFQLINSTHNVTFNVVDII